MSTFGNRDTCPMTGRPIDMYMTPKHALGTGVYMYGHHHSDGSVCLYEESRDERTFNYIPRTWAGIIGANDDPITITEPIIRYMGIDPF